MQDREVITPIGAARRWRWTVRVVVLLATPVLSGVLGALVLLATDGLSTELVAFVVFSIVPTVALAVLAPSIVAGFNTRGHGAAPRSWLLIAAGALIGVLVVVPVALVFGGMLALFGVPFGAIWAMACGAALLIAARRGGAPPGLERGAPFDWSGLIVRTAATVTGLVVLPYLAVMLGVMLDRAEPEIHLLPLGFTGPVVIVHGDSAGVPVEYEEGARVYRIPDTGVLRTQFAANAGWRAPPRLFYANPDGTRARVVVDIDAPAEERLEVHDLGFTLHVRMDSALPTPPAYRAYTVGRRDEQRGLSNRGRRVVDSVIWGIW